MDKHTPVPTADLDKFRAEALRLLRRLGTKDFSVETVAVGAGRQLETNQVQNPLTN